MSAILYTVSAVRFGFFIVCDVVEFVLASVWFASACLCGCVCERLQTHSEPNRTERKSKSIGNSHWAARCTVCYSLSVLTAYISTPTLGAQSVQPARSKLAGQWVNARANMVDFWTCATPLPNTESEKSIVYENCESVCLPWRRRLKWVAGDEKTFAVYDEMSNYRNFLCYVFLLRITLLLLPFSLFFCLFPRSFIFFFFFSCCWFASAKFRLSGSTVRLVEGDFAKNLYSVCLARCSSGRMHAYAMYNMVFFLFFHMDKWMVWSWPVHSHV